jgi:hypothetical protein
MKTLFLTFLLISITGYGQNCNCNHFISLADSEVNGNTLSILPGDMVCIESGNRGRLKFKNITGTASNPIIIKNCGGQVNIVPTAYSYGMKVEDCDYIQFTGTGENLIEYGFKISQTSGYGITMGKLTNHFEIDHFLFEETGNYAVYYKNNPDCNLSANKGTFTLEDSKLHHLKIVNSFKGIRIGHPSYDLGVNNSSCGVLEPHSVDNITLSHLVIDNLSNGDGIRLYGASATITDNMINNISGRGITVGTHCDITFKRNSVSSTTREGFRALGSGAYEIHNNVFYNNGSSSHSAITLAFENASNHSLGNVVSLTNNTIVNSVLHNFSVVYPSYATDVCVVKNNVFLSPGGSVTANANSPYLNISDVSQFVFSNNELTMNEAILKFVDYDSQNFHITHQSPLINEGGSVLTDFDFDMGYRNLAGQVDIGAFEYVPERISYFDQIDLQGLYVNDFKYILGNTAAENELLEYASDSGFNYLLLYNLDYINDNLYDITDPQEALYFANFIEKSKTEYGIVQVGVVGENNASFNKIEAFNTIYNSDWFKTVDVLNLEFEFWGNVNNNTFAYYCTKYLVPNALPCTNQGAFDYSYPEMAAIDQRAHNMGCTSEIYLGSPTNQQLLAISEVTDRVLLHYYKTSDTYNNGNSIYNYKPYRLQEIAQSNRKPPVMPIFSSRPSHMGPWLDSHSIIQPMDTWLNGQNSYYNDAAVQSVKIAGHQWYRYTDLKPSSNRSSSEDVINNMEEKIWANKEDRVQVNFRQSHEFTTVIFENENTGDYSIQIMDVSGKVVIIKKSVTDKQTHINTGDITKGMYLLVVTDNLTHSIVHTTKVMY